MTEAIFAAVLCIWFCVTALRQIGPMFPERAQWLSDYFRKWDFFSLVPVWTFFAPNPAMHDFHLLFRDKLTSGKYTPWTELRLAPTRTLLHTFWNPKKREKKALYDAASLLRTDIKALESAKAPEDAAVLSLGYLMLLNYVSNLTRYLPATGVQFALMISGLGTPEPVLIFRSNVHRCEPGLDLSRGQPRSA